jgi:hypothetical protein
MTWFDVKTQIPRFERIAPALADAQESIKLPCQLWKHKLAEPEKLSFQGQEVCNSLILFVERMRIELTTFALRSLL